MTASEHKFSIISNPTSLPLANSTVQPIQFISLVLPTTNLIRTMLISIRGVEP